MFSIHQAPAVYSISILIFELLLEREKFRTTETLALNDLSHNTTI